MFVPFLIIFVTVATDLSIQSVTEVSKNHFGQNNFNRVWLSVFLDVFAILVIKNFLQNLFNNFFRSKISNLRKSVVCFLIAKLAKTSRDIDKNSTKITKYHFFFDEQLTKLCEFYIISLIALFQFIIISIKQINRLQFILTIKYAIKS